MARSLLNASAMIKSSQRPHLFVATLALLAPLAACVADDSDSDDPAGDLGDEAWTDDGPLPQDVSSDAGESVPWDEAFAVAPRFQVPFPCNQVWAGQTRTDHS